MQDRRPQRRLFDLGPRAVDIQNYVLLGRLHILQHKRHDLLPELTAPPLSNLIDQTNDFVETENLILHSSYKSKRKRIIHTKDNKNSGSHRRHQGKHRIPKAQRNTPHRALGWALCRNEIRLLRTKSPPPNCSACRSRQCCKVRHPASLGFRPL